MATNKYVIKFFDGEEIIIIADNLSIELNEEELKISRDGKLIGSFSGYYVTGYEVIRE